MVLVHNAADLSLVYWMYPTVLLCDLQNYFMKRFLAHPTQSIPLTLVTLLCLSVGILNICTASIAEAQSSTGTIQMVRVFVRDVTLAKQEYNAGEEVQGTFTLANNGTEHLSDVHYLIRLAGEYAENGLPAVIYDSTSNGPVFVKAKESKVVSFSYKLPVHIAGEGLGIQIRAMFRTGQPMGWSDARMVVKGKMQFVSVEKAMLVIKDSEFIPGTGPTVEKGQEITAKVTLRNPTDKSTTLTPVVTMYNRSIASEPLATERKAAFSVAAGATKEVLIPLPTFNNTPRVYAGEIEFLDATGNPQATPVLVRYIVEGEIAIIERISTDQQSVKKGENISFTIEVGAAPPMVTAGSKAIGTMPVGKVDFLITIRNERDEVVAEQVKIIDLSTHTLTQKIVVPALRDANQLKIRATVVKDKKELASYATNLADVREVAPKKVGTATGTPAVQGGEGPQGAVPSASWLERYRLLVGIVLVLLLALVGWKIKKRYA